MCISRLEEASPLNTFTNKSILFFRELSKICPLLAELIAQSFVHRPRHRYLIMQPWKLRCTLLTSRSVS